MNELLLCLEQQFNKPDERSAEMERINQNIFTLRQHLNKKDRKTLLRIIDDYDMILLETKEKSFNNGIKIGFALFGEINI